MGAWLSPKTISQVTASLTLTIAVTLIVINHAKLFGLTG